MLFFAPPLSLSQLLAGLKKLHYRQCVISANRFWAHSKISFSKSPCTFCHISPEIFVQDSCTIPWILAAKAIQIGSRVSHEISCEVSMEAGTESVSFQQPPNTGAENTSDQTKIAAGFFAGTRKRGAFGAPDFAAHFPLACGCFLPAPTFHLCFNNLRE
jgi:hypothetical protein